MCCMVSVSSGLGVVIGACQVTEEDGVNKRVIGEGRSGHVMKAELGPEMQAVVRAWLPGSWSGLLS